jgi:undecaprenyl-diphosphatase
MRPAERPKLREAAALGLLQGPTELLPVSSSGHTALIPWLAGWRYAELDPELRKSFEVALHLGAGVALVLDMRGELGTAIRTLTLRRTTTIALSLLPPVLVGFALEGQIQRRLGGPRSIAAGLIAGAFAMALADIRASKRERSGMHGHEVREDGARGDGVGSKARARLQSEVGPRDGFALGLAQAAALIPGVSRSGATLTAARMRGFAREDAHALSWQAALPVILGAGALKGWRLLRGGVRSQARPALAVGALGAFVSTSVSARLLRARTRAHPLAAYAAYRCALAGFALARTWRMRRDAG